MLKENHKKMSIGEIDVVKNFLPEEEFRPLQELLMKKQGIAWYYQNHVTRVSEEKSNWRLFYMFSMVYENDQLENFHPAWENIMPLLNRIDIKALVRVKINLYPNTEKVYEHDPHFDYNWEHKACIFSINTCDGYTKLHDGTKIPSIENQALFFDGSTEHTSSTTSDDVVRMNININYF